MADLYRIVSDGKCIRIYMPNGEEMKNVTKVEIEQHGSSKMIARITTIALQPIVDVIAEKSDG